MCRYYVRATISRRMADVVKEKDLWVHSFRMPPDVNNSIKMEVGIEDCLHIEFEYNKSKCADLPVSPVSYSLPSSPQSPFPGPAFYFYLNFVDVAAKAH